MNALDYPSVYEERPWGYFDMYRLPEERFMALEEFQKALIEKYCGRFSEDMRLKESLNDLFENWRHWFPDKEQATLKILYVKPNARLSYQFHRKRSEVWICLRGNGVAQINAREIDLDAGMRVSIPRRARHRLSNVGPELLVVLEVAAGEFEEEDIVRLEDDYGRVKPGR
jgi:mannose-6-phosphate isomerase